MKKLYTVLVLLMVSVSFVNAQPAFEQRSLEEALNPDGTLKRGAQGSFKVEGYTMRTGKNGEPIFEPQTQHTASGTWDTQFGLPNGVSGAVYAVAADGQGNVYVGGSFIVVGGISTPVNNIARFNTQTNTWSSLGTGSSNGVSISGYGYGEVNALAVVGNEVYVGGSFTSAGGVSANNVARFNTQTNTWSRLGTGSSNGVNGEVRALAVVGNEVVVGGTFTSAGGVSANSVARFNTQTNTWSTLGTGSSNGVNGEVRALAVVGNEVVVGGTFTSAGGVSANSVARFNTQTNTWSSLGTGSSNGVNGEVRALAVVGNEMYVGGIFTSAGGVSANYVARFNTQTNTWSTLGTGSSNGVNGAVRALAVVGNEVYVGGIFTSAGGVSANNVARFNTQTNTWSTLGTGSSNGVNGEVRALAVVGNEVYVGGIFTSAGGVSANSVARFNTQTNTWSSLGMFSSNGVNGWQCLCAGGGGQ
jgi:N-acetylneuraminic acid mutarotase